MAGMDFDSCKAGQTEAVEAYRSCSIVDMGCIVAAKVVAPKVVVVHLVAKKDHKCQMDLKVAIVLELEFSSCLEAT